MIIQECVEFILKKLNLRLLTSLKSLKLGLKLKVDAKYW
jgi:hypothetical protein